MSEAEATTEVVAPQAEAPAAAGRSVRSTRGKRRGHEKRSVALAALAAKTRYEVQEEEAVYEMVDEQSYKELQESRLADGNFVVVDDDPNAVGGYADYGGEMWDHDDYDDEEGPLRGAKKERLKGIDRNMALAAARRRRRSKKRIAKVFVGGQGLQSKVGPGEGDTGGVAEGDDKGVSDFLENAFDELDEDPMGSTLDAASLRSARVAERKRGRRRTSGKARSKADAALFESSIEEAREFTSPVSLSRSRHKAPFSPNTISQGDGTPADTRAPASKRRKMGSKDDGDGDDEVDHGYEFGGPETDNTPPEMGSLADSDAAPQTALPKAPERKSNVTVRGKRKIVPRAEAPVARSLRRNAASGPSNNGAAEAGELNLGGDSIESLSSAGADWWSVLDQNGGTGGEANGGAGGEAKKATQAFGGGGSLASLPFNEDGDLEMFWLDAYEDRYNAPSKIFLMGKVKVAAEAPDEDPASYASCCVTVCNMDRQLHFLPREFALGDDGFPTDRPVTEEMVHAEVAEVMRRNRITQWKCKFDLKSYAFEEAGVPDSATYCVVLYSAEFPAISRLTTGRTFARVFGAEASMLELFLLKNKLKGPSWIKLGGVKENHKKISWCKTEGIMSNPRAVVVDRSRTSSPPLRVASICLKTIFDQRTNTNEIVVASVLIHDAVQADGETFNPMAGYYHFSMVRKLKTTPFPHDLQKTVRAANLKLYVHNSEKAMLNMLLAKIHLIDPDVLVGHNISGFSLDVLLHRMRANKCGQWSKIGRLRRSKMPKLQSGPGGTGDSTFGERAVVAGRLMCDTYTTAKELIRKKNYSLAYLSSQLLGIERAPIEASETANYFTATPALIDFVRHTENDCFLALGVMFNLQMIPLSKQLTELSGNLWRRTLQGGRAERIEYLLLHEFWARNFVVPDKVFTKSVKGGPRRAKAAYAGGLVLAPKRGFYDKYVLLLDFNSLYPSIIQEYNLCYTTVTRVKNEDPAFAANRPSDADDDDEDPDAVAAALEDVPSVPDLPDDSMEPGILPALIRKLVQRRAVIKGLIKGEKKKARRDRGKLAEYDVRQKALKLTANSMYGCLGYSKSRFYAKPIAALVTSMGREILQRTVDLAQSELGLDVIYGDTDSIMVNTGSTNLDEVKLIGNRVKAEVNKQFKLLEIEIDGVYKSMLLLQKKKYAALMIEEREGGVPTTVREMKGLDMVRRDWCGLSKETGEYVLDQILSGDAADEVVNRIHEKLRELGGQVRRGEIAMDKFVITKGLTKNPEEYSDARSQPHVQVALRLKRQGKAAGAGSHVPYVVCEGAGNVSERAYHPTELDRAGPDGLRIDFEWYLGNQILPPVGRLVDPISGTDLGQIADCLGLDAAKYARAANRELDAFTARRVISDEEKYAECDRLEVVCPACKLKQVFAGVFRMLPDGSRICGLTCRNPVSAESMAAAAAAAAVAEEERAAAVASAAAAEGETEGDAAPEPMDAAPTGDSAAAAAVPTATEGDAATTDATPAVAGATTDMDAAPTRVVSGCNGTFSMPRLANAITRAVRDHLQRYYAGWMVCDEKSCQNRTRQLSLKQRGFQCLIPNCTGTMEREYSSQAIYTQLLYYASLCDVPHALDRTADESRVAALTDEELDVFAGLAARMEAELGKCAYHFVDLSNLLSFFTTKPEARKQLR